MEEKKYEAGRVEISSAEYRDLVTEAVEARRDASEIRSERWNLESENRKLKEELDLTRKRVAELENINEALRGASQVFNTPSHPQPAGTTRPPWWSEVTCGSSVKGENENV